MGFPNQWRLTRKLVKCFIKKRAPNYKKEELDSTKNALLQCYKSKGLNSTACDPLYYKYIEAFKERKEFLKKIEEKKLAGYIINELNTPVYSKLIKGKYRDMFTGFRPKANSLYDGIKKK